MSPAPAAPPRIGIAGAAGEPQTEALRTALGALGEPVFLLDTLAFPATVHLSLSEREARWGDEPFPPLRVLYLRHFFSTPGGYGVDADADMRANWRATLAAFAEKRSLLTGLVQRLEAAGTIVVNSLASADRTNKPYQLSLLSAAGVPVPRTLLSNSPAAVRAFAREMKSVIYKPVTGGAMTKILTERDLTDERLATLASAPVTFQEYVPGADIRVYVVDGRVVAAAHIRSTEVDFRAAEGDLVPVDLPPAAADWAVRGARALGLFFTGIDFKRSPEDRWAMLECNPSPMFHGFDAKSGLGVAAALAKGLARLAQGRP